MKTTTKSFLASNKLNEVKNQLEDKHLQSKLVSVLDKINLRETFEMNQDINDLADSYSTDNLEVKEKLSKKHWYSLVDFLREKIYLYESHSDKEYVVQEISKKLEGYNPEDTWMYKSANLDRIDEHLEFLTNYTTISFDVEKGNFVFAKTEDFKGTRIQIDLESGEENLHLLPLFNFSFLCSLRTMVEELDDKLVLLFMKNACRLLSNEDLASELISEMKSNFIKVVEDWTINFNDGELHFDVFPIDFYSPDFLNKKLSSKKYSDFFKSFNQKQNNKNVKSNPKNKIKKFFYFEKIKNYYKDFLIQLLESKIDFEEYPYCTTHNKKVYQCSKDEILNLKNDLIPILEKLEDEGKIFVNPYYYFHHYTPKKGDGGRNFVKYCCNKNGILMELFDLLDWYPNKFRIYHSSYSNIFFVKDLEKYSYIKYVSEIEGFDYKIFIELNGYSDCKWPISRKDQLNNIAKKVLGNGTIFIPDDKSISKEQKDSERYFFYNNDIESKFILSK